MKKITALFLILILTGCASKTAQNSNDLSTIQTLDRNGFSETISAKERLGKYENTDFLTPQPYQKVVRVFGKSSQGKTSSKVTTYHTNGQPWQYLEVENGRAHGKFMEWHPNGQLKVEAYVIEGTPDISQVAQLTWFFEGLSLVYDDQGHLIAKVFYEKGLLEGTSLYFHPNGTLSKEIPYHKNEIHGLVQFFNEQGTCMEKANYTDGLSDGSAIAIWSPTQNKYTEEWEKGLLLNGTYYAADGKEISRVENSTGFQAIFDHSSLISLMEYQKGIPEGEIKNFNSKGQLVSLYHIKNGMKEGEEWEYYPSNDAKPSPKLCLNWKEDTMQGTVKTWYENGVLESQREMHDNKKHGSSYAWFKDGGLMLTEEYENDHLTKGSYFKKDGKKPISKIENGKGIATLSDKEGRLIKKIVYEKGIPQQESL
jgi:antitoxin component YwqK of YwqJK toxin-antitoxin module